MDKDLKSMDCILEKYSLIDEDRLINEFLISIGLLVAGSITDILLVIGLGGVFYGKLGFDLFKNVITIRNLSKEDSNYFNNSLEYYELKKVYVEVLDEIVKFMKKNKCKCPMEFFAMYSYLVRNGYLSLDKKFCYDIDVKNDVFSLRGINVIEGRGVCSHITSMLTDILVGANYGAENVNMNINDFIQMNFSFDDFLGDKGIYNVEDNFSTGNKVNFFSNLINNIYSYNHMATFVKDNTTSYIMDPTNDTLFVVDANHNVFPINNFSDKVRVSIKKKIRNVTDMERLQKDVYKYRNIWNWCLDSNESFDKFYRKHRDMYEEVLNRKEIFIKKREKVRNYFYQK